MGVTLEFVLLVTILGKYYLWIWWKFPRLTLIQLIRTWQHRLTKKVQILHSNNGLRTTNLFWMLDVVVKSTKEWEQVLFKPTKLFESTARCMTFPDMLLQVLRDEILYTTVNQFWPKTHKTSSQNQVAVIFVPTHLSVFSPWINCYQFS